MVIATTRTQRRVLAAENMRRPCGLAEIPRAEWPPSQRDNPTGPLRVWRSRDFLVQLYAVPAGIAPHGAGAQLSVNRTTMRPSGRWEDGITWDQLQALKAQAGFGDCWAVEVYPAADQLVDVANVRHLFLLDHVPGFAWVDSHG